MAEDAKTPHRAGSSSLPRRGPGAEADEAGRRRRAARPRRHPALPAPAAGRPGDQGHPGRRPDPARDAAGVLQRDGQGRQARRLARGVHVRPGEGERADAVPAAHRAGRQQAGRAQPPAARPSTTDGRRPARTASRCRRSSRRTSGRSWAGRRGASCGAPELEQAKRDYAARRERDRGVRAGDDGRRRRATRRRRAAALDGDVEVVERADRRLVAARQRPDLPAVGRRAARGAAALFGFNAWGEKFTPYDDDAALAGEALRAAGKSRLTSPGWCSRAARSTSTAPALLVTTEQCLLHPSRNPGMSRGARSRSACSSSSAPTRCSGWARASSRTATPTATST